MRSRAGRWSSVSLNKELVPDPFLLEPMSVSDAKTIQVEAFLPVRAAKPEVTDPSLPAAWQATAWQARQTGLLTLSRTQTPSGDVT